MTDTLNPGELVAQLPYALGFYPTTETVVVVGEPDRRRLWDFPPGCPAVDVAASIAAHCPVTAQTRVTPVLYADRVDFSVELDANDLATALSAYFSLVDAPVIATPDGWRHAVECPGRCCSDAAGSLNPAALPGDLAHEAATTWPTPMASRGELVDYFAPDPMQRTLAAAARPPAARQLRTAILGSTNPAAWRHAATEQVWAQLTSVRPQAPGPAARTLLQLQDTYVADAILMRILHDPAPANGDKALTALRGLCRSAPDDLAPAALSTWAHAAASRGDAPRAFAAISRAQQLTPRHHPTSVLRRLLLDGVDPTDLAAVRLPEDSLLNTADPISPAVVSGAGPAGPPQPPPPAAGPPPPTPGRTR